MKTEFIELSTKREIMNRLESGDTLMIPYVINEIERLENIVRDYELGMEMVADRLNNTRTYKTPNKFPA